MRPQSVCAVLPPEIPRQLPTRMVQTTSLSASLMKLAVMLPVTIALLIPFLLIAERVATSDDFRALINARPGSAVQIAVGLAFWTLLFAWPLKRLADQLSRVRAVEIDDDHVRVSDSGLFRNSGFEAPLAEFTGLAHNIRTSLSGVRHELVLVHPMRQRSVLIAIAPRLDQRHIDEVCRLLRCAEISSKELYKVQLPGLTLARNTRGAVTA